MKRISLCLTMLCLSLLSFSQHTDNIQVALPSPNNMAPVDAKSINVNYYQGTPNISLPLYTLESSELSVPIAINYKATGVKLHDYASSVGINWSLQAGGSITRIVRGLPDESVNGYFGLNNTGQHINGPNVVVSERSTKIAAGEWDGEPDLFVLTTPSESVYFVFDENKIPVFTSPTRMKVFIYEPTGPSEYDQVYCTAVDEKGNQYKFGSSAASREVVEGSVKYVSTWFLDEIKSFNGTDIINIEYTAGPDVTTNKHIKLKLAFSYTGGASGPPSSTSEYDQSTTYKSPKYVSRISSGRGAVSFKYTNDRLDLNGAYRLASISISNKNELLKNIKFRHNYYDAPNASMDLNRLCLQDIYLQTGNGLSSIKLYGFNYFYQAAYKFPGRNSAAFDHWGYYNNNGSSTPYPPDADKSPNLEKTRQYTLKEIEYGLGGKTVFDYQLNNYFDNVSQTNKASGGLRIGSVTEIDNQGTALTRQFEYTLPGPGGRSSGEPSLKNFAYNKRHVMIFLPSASSIIGDGTLNTILFNTYDWNGVSNGYKRVKVTNPDGGTETYTYKGFSDFADQHYVVNGNSGAELPIDAVRQFGYSTSYAHRRGAMTGKTLYDSDGDKVLEIVYKYPATPAETRKSRGVSITAIRSYAGSSMVEWLQTIYYHVKDDYQLIGETEKTYDALDPSVVQVTEKDYVYSPDGTLLRQTTTSNADGTSNVVKNYYPLDRNEIAGLSAEDNLAFEKMENIVIPIRQEETKGGGGKRIMHTSYKIESAGPGVERVFPTATSLAKYDNVLVPKEKFGFDIFTGNQIFERSRDGVPQSTLYNNDKLVIAAATNATNGEIYLQNFEESALGIEGNARTGRKYYNSTSYAIPFVRPNQRRYKLSYGRFVNNKWEHVLQDYNSDNLVLSAPHPIDDILVYPEDASVVTYTHIPMVGVTSKAEPNNAVTYYEYDEFQRLKVVRDKDGNIAKRYEYISACNCPLPVPYARLEYRNPSSEDAPEYHREFAHVYLTFTDANGNPLPVQGLVVSIMERIEKNGVIQESTQLHTGNGTETYLGNLKLMEQLFTSGGAVYEDFHRMLFVEPGFGYHSF